MHKIEFLFELPKLSLCKQLWFNDCHYASRILTIIFYYLIIYLIHMSRDVNRKNTTTDYFTKKSHRYDYMRKWGNPITMMLIQSTTLHISTPSGMGQSVLELRFRIWLVARDLLKNWKTHLLLFVSLHSLILN